MRAYTDSKDAIWNNLIKACKKTCSFDIPHWKKNLMRDQFCFNEYKKTCIWMYL